MINTPTKFEVSMFTHYEDMKGNTKCRNWGGLGVQQSLKVAGNVTIDNKAHTTSCLTLIETMHLSCTVFEL